MPGVSLAEGSVIAAGAVVTKSINLTNQILGGVPAKVIGIRAVNQYDYKLNYFPFFDTDVIV